MSDRVSKHYDSKYFAWHSTFGDFGGWANLSKFAPYIKTEDTVLDFGCGGGFLLRNIDCRNRIGVEVNPDAITVARSQGIEVYSQTEDVPDDCCDIVISHHALEHTLHPLQEIKALRPKLRNQGKLVIVVPCESVTMAYTPKNINNHLYSWSPMSLGNLLTEAGYHVLKSEPYIHKWPPFYQSIARLGGRPLFDLACKVYGRIERTWYQVRAVAEKAPQ